MFKTRHFLGVISFAVLPANLLAGPGYNTGTSHLQIPAPTEQEIKNGDGTMKIPSDLDVPPAWQPLLNPTYVDYWREGNHLPDAGFILFARNPSIKTAKLWLLRMESKARNLEELQKFVTQAQVDLVQQGFIKDRYKMVTNSLERANLARTETKYQPNKELLAKLTQLDFYFLFSPQCPYCRKMAATLQSLPNIVPLQVTKGDLIHWDGLPKSIQASKETKTTYLNNNEVPVLVISDNKSKKVMRLRGNQSLESIVMAASSMLSETQGRN